MKKFNLSKGLVIGLLTLALCFTCFGIVKASAEESTLVKTTEKAATYNATKDAIQVTDNTKAYVYVLKAASGNLIKAGTAATAEIPANKTVSITDLGIKATNKDVYLYVCDREVEVEAGETVKANLTIKGNAAKLKGVVDYTKADDDAIGSEDANVTVLGATKTVNKATKKVDNLLWSTDGETWYGANDNTSVNRECAGKKQETTKGFNGADLKSMLEAGGLIYIKEAGVDGETGTAAFGSKAVKLKIAKQAKAPKAKVDVTKDTIALKNGFDFAEATKPANSKEYTEYHHWTTILPVLKTASNADAVVPTYKFTPLDKKDSRAGKPFDATDETAIIPFSYTKTVVKSMTLDSVLEYICVDESDDFQVAIRKSATSKKPASAVTTIALGFPAAAPIVYTADNVDGYFVVSSADEFTKNGLSFGEIAAYPGYDGSGVATSGYNTTFKLTGTSSTSGNDSGSSFEYIVVSAADYIAPQYLDADGESSSATAGTPNKNAIDWATAKWKKLDTSKLKITEKLVGQYSLIGGSKKKVNLKAGSTDLATADSGTEVQPTNNRTIIRGDKIADAGTLILVRRAGDKTSSTRASQPIALYVFKDGKTWYLESTVSNGCPAKKYTLNFAKWTGGEWKADDALTITLFAADGDDKEKEITSLVSKAKLYQATVSDDTWTLGDAFPQSAVSGVTVATSGGKTKATFAGANAGKETLNLIIRQGANVKVTLKIAKNEDATASSGVTITNGFASREIGKVTDGIDTKNTTGSSGSITAYVGAASGGQTIYVQANAFSGAATTSNSGSTGVNYKLTSVTVGGEELAASSYSSYGLSSNAITDLGNLTIPDGAIESTSALEIVLNYSVQNAN